MFVWLRSQRAVALPQECKDCKHKRNRGMQDCKHKRNKGMQDCKGERNREMQDCKDERNATSATRMDSEFDSAA